jgi:hypothetical protein
MRLILQQIITLKSILVKTMPFLAPPRYLDSVKMHSDIANDESARKMIDYKIQEAQNKSTQPDLDAVEKRRALLGKVSRSIWESSLKAGKEGTPEFMAEFTQRTNAFKPIMAQAMGDPNIMNSPITPESIAHVKAYAAMDSQPGEIKNHLTTFPGKNGNMFYFDTANGGKAMPMQYEGENGAVPAIDARQNPDNLGAIERKKSENKFYSQDINGRTGLYSGGELVPPEQQPTTVQPPAPAQPAQTYQPPMGNGPITKISDGDYPPNPNAGDTFFNGDQDLRWTGAAWVDPATGAPPRQQGQSTGNQPGLSPRPQSESTAEKEQIKSNINMQEAQQKSDIAVNEATRKEEEKTKLKAKEELPKVIRDTGYLKNLLTKLKDHKGLEGVVGIPGVYGLSHMPGTDEANFRVLLEQIKGKDFLQAFTDLKGGGAGAITDIEGKKATDAIARLDTAQTEEEFKNAIDEFISVLDDAESNAKTKAGVGGIKPFKLESNKPSGKMDLHEQADAILRGG